MKELRATAGFWLRSRMGLSGSAVAQYLYLLQTLSGLQLLHYRKSLSVHVAVTKSLLLATLDNTGHTALQLLHKQLSFLWTPVQRGAESTRWGRMAMDAVSDSLQVMKKPGQGRKPCLDFTGLLSSLPCHPVFLKITFLFPLNSIHLFYLYQHPSYDGFNWGLDHLRI